MAFICPTVKSSFDNCIAFRQFLLSTSTMNAVFTQPKSVFGHLTICHRFLSAIVALHLKILERALKRVKEETVYKN